MSNIERNVNAGTSALFPSAIQVSSEPHTITSAPSLPAIQWNGELNAVTSPLFPAAIRGSSELNVGTSAPFPPALRRSGESNAVASAPFPPAIQGSRELMSFVDGWCDAISPANVYEGACAVCARATPVKELHTVDMSSIDLSILCRPGEGITRKERMRPSDPVSELEGPILYESGRQGKYIYVCVPCLESLRKRQLPKSALANGMWIGDAPECLRQLTFMERIVIALERHNCFVVKVTMGQYKMNANAVIFGQPVRKVYERLPPPRADIADCVAMLFVGPCKPTSQEYKRTPFIVRRRAIIRALEWLILNHPDYEHIRIAYDLLDEYPEDEPPVCVVYRYGNEDLPAESQPSYGGRDNEGISEDECTFSVQGLSEDAYIGM
ncbi:hypothetical protein C8Q70DRAFT_910041, partial [Cubamyces menziesii]